MIRLKSNQELHDRFVLSTASELKGMGYSTIYADLPGFSRPPIISGFVPDVYATNGLYEFVVEVETMDTKDTTHTSMQISAFKGYVSASPNTRKYATVMAQ